MVRRRALSLATVLALAVGGAGCVQVTWQRQSVGRALDGELVDWALSTRPDLGAALERLGAPHRVRRLEERGTELTWRWRRASGLSVTGSVPLDQGNASLQLAEDRARLEGVRLVFDPVGRFVEGAAGLVAREDSAPGLPLLP